MYYLDRVLVDVVLIDPYEVKIFPSLGPGSDPDLLDFETLLLPLIQV